MERKANCDFDLMNGNEIKANETARNGMKDERITKLNERSIKPRMNE